MAKLNPYLTFSGNCREAMNYYKQCLGGELSFIVAGEYPVANQVPASMKDHMLHFLLKADELELMATDMQAESMNEGNAVRLCLSCKTEEETRNMFDKLSGGGKVK